MISYFHVALLDDNPVVSAKVKCFDDILSIYRIYEQFISEDRISTVSTYYYWLVCQIHKYCCL